MTQEVTQQTQEVEYVKPDTTGWKAKDYKKYLDNFFEALEEDENNQGYTIDFESVLDNEDYDRFHKEGKIGGLSYEFVETERENEYYYFRFKLDGKLFELAANYDSWGGVDIYDDDFYRVEPKEITKVVYRAVKED